VHDFTTEMTVEGGYLVSIGVIVLFWNICRCSCGCGGGKAPGPREGNMLVAARSTPAYGRAVRRVLWLTLFLNVAVSVGKLVVGWLTTT